MARQREADGSSESAGEGKAGERGATEEASVGVEEALVSVRLWAKMMQPDLRGERNGG